MIGASHVISFIGLLALAASLPLSERKELEAVAPRIIYPTAGVTWCIGASHHVYWDTSTLPPPQQITNPMGQIYLVSNDRVDFNHPLTNGFPITAGQVTLTVPSVSPGSYAVDLYGDAGNWSQYFRIDYC